MSLRRLFTQSAASPCWLRVVSRSRGIMAEEEASIPAKSEKAEPKAKGKKPRPFDFSKYNRRRVAMRVAYLGGQYQGFSIQDDTTNTVEKCLFDAMKTTRLVEDRQSCFYSRCGRTDAGVSALGQVISLEVRSNLLEGPGVIVPPDSTAHTRKGDSTHTTQELPYALMLNRNLPDTIRVLGWCDVPTTFSARFSCKSRTYKYFFPRGNMDLDAMRAAAKHFVGQHDYRNVCNMHKIVNDGITNFVRTVTKVDIDTLDDGPATPYQMCEATIEARSFLMHQVRCMMSLLFLVGNGLEQPSIVAHVLDIERCPCKPGYGMAAPDPLVLFDSQYEQEMNWTAEKGEEKKLLKHLQRLWTFKSVESVMLKRMLDSLTDSLTTQDPPVAATTAPLMTDHKLGGPYRPLLKRPTSNSLEEAHQFHLAKKRKKEEMLSEEQEKLEKME